MRKISNNYFVTKPYMFLRASSEHIIRSYLLYAAQLVRFMQVMWPLPSRLRLKLQFQPDSASKRSHNLHETYQLQSVQQITPDDRHRRCPKRRVLWRSKFWIFDASSWLFYMNLTILWIVLAADRHCIREFCLLVMTPCRLVICYLCFGVTYCYLLH